MLASILFSFFMCSPIGLAQVAPDATVGVLPQLFVHGDHFSVGQQMGYATKDNIKYRLSHMGITDTISWVETTSDGAAAYDAMLNTANQTFPEYVVEIEGIAYGSGFSFQTIFILNVRNELNAFKSMAEGKATKAKDEIEHCSDYLLNDAASSSTLFIGHNEDGGVEDRDRAALITVHMEGKGVREEIKYTAFVYAGDIPCDAFFWNDFGVIGSMNGLYPIENLFGGLGRNFMSRDLVGAKSVDDAVSRLTIPNQATGHSYNLMSTKEHQLLNLEVAPGVTNDKASLYQVTLMETKPSDNSLFHANKYKFLEVEQSDSFSSDHRMARAAELPAPTSAEDILAVLGDTADSEYPVYRTASGDDNGYTLTTALFTVNLEHPYHSTVDLYLSNPHTNSGVHITKGLVVE